MTMISDKQRKALFGLLDKAGLKEERASWLQANAGVSSVSDLSADQAKALIVLLQPEAKRKEDARQRMGRKVIHLLCELGYTEAGRPNYAKINTYVAQIGTNNPAKKALWRLNNAEMQAVLSQITARHKKEFKAN
jgi:hypothetical protein